MKNLLLFCAIILCMASCSTTKVITYDKVKKREFTILSTAGEKSFTVDLVDNKSKEIYKGVLVAKKCDTWKLYRAGDVVTLKVATYTIDGQKFTDFLNIKKTMCK